MRGTYGVLPNLPATPGLEGVGTVEAIGADVTGIQPGTRVIPLGAGGTWSEYAVTPATNAIVVPNELTDDVAAQFVVNPFTAWIMTVEELKMQPGEWLIQTAAGSTLGRMIIQIAKHRGFKTINLVRRREQADELFEIGADAVICTEDENLEARINEITDGRGVSKAIDAVGGETGAAVARQLNNNATMLVYGALSQKPLTLDPRSLIFKGTNVRGFWLNHWFESAAPEKVQQVSFELMQLMLAGVIILSVEAVYPFEEFQAAVLHSETPGRSGKILIVN